jgi:hexokinase
MNRKRRAHLKSREGCEQCKERHVKVWVLPVDLGGTNLRERTFKLKESGRSVMRFIHNV